MPPSEHGLDVVSPALVEGALDYDFEAHAAAFVAAMAGTLRPGWFHGVCFAVRRAVFETIGFPDTDRRLGGREDVEFLVRCQRNDVPVGTVGDALLHHFGSITQKAIKLETGQKDLGDREYFYRRSAWAGSRASASRPSASGSRGRGSQRSAPGTATRCTCCARTGAGATRRICERAQAPAA